MKRFGLTATCLLLLTGTAHARVDCPAGTKLYESGWTSRTSLYAPFLDRRTWGARWEVTTTVHNVGDTPAHTTVNSMCPLSVALDPGQTRSRTCHVREWTRTGRYTWTSTATDTGTVKYFHAVCQE